MIQIPHPANDHTVMMSRSELLWGAVLYGIVMWAAGFVWAGMVL